MGGKQSKANSSSSNQPKATSSSSNQSKATSSPINTNQSNATSSPIVTKQLKDINDIRNELKTLNSDIKAYFFGDSFFKDHKYIYVSDSQFLLSKYTYNILSNNNVSDEYMKKIDESKKYIENLYNASINLKNSKYNSYDIGNRINDVALYCKIIFDHISVISDHIKKNNSRINRTRVTLDDHVSSNFEFLYFLIRKKIYCVKIVLESVYNYITGYDGTICNDNTVILSNFKNANILLNSYILDGKLFQNPIDFYNSLKKNINEIKQNSTQEQIDYYETMENIIDVVSNIDRFLKDFLYSLSYLYDDIILAFNQNCPTVQSSGILTNSLTNNLNIIIQSLSAISSNDDLTYFNTMKDKYKNDNLLNNVGPGSDAEYQAILDSLFDQMSSIKGKINTMKHVKNNQEYYTRLRNITNIEDFKTQTDREPQDFIAQIKLKNIGGKQNINNYKYITEDSLGKAASNNRARELANQYNRLTDKMIETEKKIGGIQKLAMKDLNQSENGYVRMRGGEQQTNDYNNLIKQYQLMTIKQNNIINEIKNIKNRD